MKKQKRKFKHNGTNETISLFKVYSYEGLPQLWPTIGTYFQTTYSYKTKHHCTWFCYKNELDCCCPNSLQSSACYCGSWVVANLRWGLYLNMQHAHFVFLNKSQDGQNHSFYLVKVQSIPDCKVYFILHYQNSLMFP